jgi:DNA gyrase/topoisomerase IV subunit B
MPMEKGILTLRGNVFVAYTCEEDNFRVAKAHDLSLRMAATTMEAKKTPLNQLEIPELEAPCKSIKSKEYKEIQLVEGDSSKTTLIGTNLNPK